MIMRTAITTIATQMVFIHFCFFPNAAFEMLKNKNLGSTYTKRGNQDYYTAPDGTKWQKKWIRTKYWKKNHQSFIIRSCSIIPINIWFSKFYIKHLHLLWFLTTILLVTTDQHHSGPWGYNEIGSTVWVRIDLKVKSKFPINNVTQHASSNVRTGSFLAR